MTSDSTQPPDTTAKRGATTAAAYAVPALTKAMEVLELMAGQPGGLTASDIVLRLNRSMGELYRIIVALQRLGLLTRNERNERYSLSLKLFEMSHRHPPTARLIHFALPILEALAEQSEQSAHLGVLDGDQLIVLAQADSPRSLRYAVRVGASFPALETSSGVVIVAHSEPRVQEHHLASLPESERPAMKQRFESAARLGYERHLSAAVTGVINLSRPVFDHAGAPLAAMTTPYLQQIRSRTDIDGTLELAIQAADELSQSLGWTKQAATDQAETAPATRTRTR